jgi:hypothetical protein
MAPLTVRRQRQSARDGTDDDDDGVKGRETARQVNEVLSPITTDLMRIRRTVAVMMFTGRLRDEKGRENEREREICPSPGCVFTNMYTGSKP